jgi:hypothetical protein
VTARLLLDEMFSPALAKDLRGRGYDAVAIAADPQFAGMTDEQVLGLATTEDRCVLTENVRDFELIRARWVREGRGHAGLLYTNVQRFPRGKRYIGRLVAALETRLVAGRLPSTGQVDWLT